MTTHYEEQLSALLSGELTGGETREVVAHLRECGECTSALISVAVAHGSLRAARRSLSAAPIMPVVEEGTASPSLAALAPLALPRRVPIWTRVAAAAAAALVVAVGLGVLAATTHHAAPSVAAVASLHHLDAPSSAQGRVTVHATAVELQMHVVTVGLPTLAANHFYEVWLLNPTSNKMLPLGVLSVTGVSTFTIAKPIMSQFSAVDISLQDNNGSPQHSSTSVLRGQVIAA